jgi:hypothetical protein
VFAAVVHALHAALAHMALHLVLTALLSARPHAVAHLARVGVCGGGKSEGEGNCGSDFGEGFHDRFLCLKVMEVYLGSPRAAVQVIPGSQSDFINALTCNPTVSGKRLLVSLHCRRRPIDTLRYNFSG